MRGEYDTVENLEYKKNKCISINKFTTKILITLIFIVFCGLCFKVVYTLSFNNIEKNIDDKSVSKQNSSSKVYIIEQKLRKDLEKMNSKPAK
jgi:hypothetical protein